MLQLSVRVDGVLIDRAERVHLGRHDVWGPRSIVSIDMEGVNVPLQFEPIKVTGPLRVLEEPSPHLEANKVGRWRLELARGGRGLEHGELLLGYQEVPNSSPLSTRANPPRLQLSVPYSVMSRVQAPGEEAVHTESSQFAWAARYRASATTRTIVSEALVGGRPSGRDQEFFFGELLPGILKRALASRRQGRQVRAEDVEDAVATTVMKISSKISELDYPSGKDAVSAWMMWTKYAYIDAYRKSKRQTEFLSSKRAGTHDADDAEDYEEARELVAAAFCKLEPGDRDLLWRKYRDCASDKSFDKPFAELASELGEYSDEAQQKIQRRESRARERLARSLDRRTVLALLRTGRSPHNEKVDEFYLLGGDANEDGHCEIPQTAIREYTQDILRGGSWTGAEGGATLIYPPHGLQRPLNL
jgi:RNA polymerase sigma factor (sigma-70 family)